MIKPDYGADARPQIDIDDLAAVIRDSMSASKDHNAPVHNGNAAGDHRPPHSIPELKLQPEFQPRADDRYHVNDLLQYHDRAFLEAAYRAVLKRPPGEAEYLRDRKRLQSGSFNKIDLLSSLRFSPEGKAKKVQLDGLAVPALIRRLGQVPLLGYVISLGIAFLRLPNHIRDQRQLAAYVLAQNQQIADFINAVTVHVDQCRDGISRLNDNLSKQAELMDKLSGQQTQLDQTTSELSKRIDVSKDILMGRIEDETERRFELRQLIIEQQELVSQMHADVQRVQLGLQHARSELTLHGRNLDTRAATSKDVFSLPQPAGLNTHQLDAFYAALEDRFRGSRETIKEQFRVYLPYVKEAAPLIDLGCGRGEWLEILKEEGISARGIDLNLVQVDQCVARGLDVVQHDFLGYLSSVADASVGAVTGFHIIEHLPIEQLVELVNEVTRVLRPGGVVIFETPNPENVLVGSNFFYMDPTHHHPLPSELMQFVFENSGFHPVEILKLHPWDAGRVSGETDVADRLNAYFYGPMDYAILGWKLGP